MAMLKMELGSDKKDNDDKEIICVLTVMMLHVDQTIRKWAPRLLIRAIIVRHTEEMMQDDAAFARRI